jgi:hypothetical protein
MYRNQYYCVQICQRNFTANIPCFHGICCLALTTLSFVTIELGSPAATDNDHVQNIGQQINQ